MKTKRYKTRKNSLGWCNSKPEIEVGSIVVLSEHCHRGGELAIVVERTEASASAVKVVYLKDMEQGCAQHTAAIVGNLTKLETEVENQEAKK